MWLLCLSMEGRVMIRSREELLGVKVVGFIFRYILE